MELKYVTCSGANEHTNIKDMIALSEQFPKVEFGIQVSGKKCGQGSARESWLKELIQAIKRERKSIFLALHLNQDWVENFCEGRVTPQLSTFLTEKDWAGKPIFQRVQLNFKIGREKMPQIEMVEEMIKRYPEIRFILSASEANKNFIRKLYHRGQVKFDCLYDESFGEGQLPSDRKYPLFDDVLQGYAGGLSPENVERELEKISEKQPYNGKFYIDAEGKLKGENGRLSLERCEHFIRRAIIWEHIINEHSFFEGKRIVK